MVRPALGPTDPATWEGDEGRGAGRRRDACNQRDHRTNQRRLIAPAACLLFQTQIEGRFPNPSARTRGLSSTCRSRGP
ncbi:hypothetical protein DPEC_G00281870 [Dallia pectoralis]|uniref:Uncharacterized protein n=1 Tax=Dallia pectoralis TaxID=75939 RepID=A0ACC2FN58_DALPE|nr:hypothetical protein DPEC_G00281870 [Dallia pectoralis]